LANQRVRYADEQTNNINIIMNNISLKQVDVGPRPIPQRLRGYVVSPIHGQIQHCHVATLGGTGG